MPTTTPTDQKSVKERDNLDLLELVCQLNGRLTTFPSEAMHDAYWEARKELEERLERLPVEHPVQGSAEEIVFDKKDWDAFKLRMGDRCYQGLINIEDFVSIMGELEDKSIKP